MALHVTNMWKNQKVNSDVCNRDNHVTNAQLCLEISIIVTNITIALHVTNVWKNQTVNLDVCHYDNHVINAQLCFEISILVTNLRWHYMSQICEKIKH